mgnify:CR=1 FL=1
MGRKPTLRDRIRPLLQQGYTNAEIKAALPDVAPASIPVVVSRLRKEHGMKCTPLAPGSRPIFLPKHLHDQIATEAIVRGGKSFSPNDLALRLLAIIVRDDLYDAILGEAK